MVRAAILQHVYKCGLPLCSGVRMVTLFNAPFCHSQGLPPTTGGEAKPPVTKTDDVFSALPSVSFEEPVVTAKTKAKSKSRNASTKQRQSKPRQSKIENNKRYNMTPTKCR